MLQHGVHDLENRMLEWATVCCTVQVLPYATWATTRKFAQPAVAQAAAGDNGVRRNGLAAMSSRRQQDHVGRVQQPDRLADALPSAKRRRCGPQSIL